MALDKNATIMCTKCHKTLKVGNFYTSNNTDKYPNGIIPICKKCLTMHVDNWDPKTYLWILQEIDVPYIPEEWDSLLARYGKDKSKVNGMTILGRYVSKMRMKQFNVYRWKDSQFLQELNAKKKAEAMESMGMAEDEIAKTLEEQKVFIPEKVEQPPEEEERPETPDAPRPDFDEPDENESISLIGGQKEDPADFGLTDEDVTYLKLKWGAAYKPSEWIYMEKYYQQFMDKFSITTPAHEDTLRKLAKCSLKLEQLIDVSDIDGAQKMQKMYDSLMRSGNFTAVQNKQEDENKLQSIGELVAMCELDGFIPRFYTDKPEDKVDLTILDMENYTKDLVENETDIGALIDNAVKQLQKDKDKEEETEKSEEDTDAALFKEDSVKYLTQEDYTDFNDFEDELSEEDKKAIEKAGNE